MWYFTKQRATVSVALTATLEPPKQVTAIVVPEPTEAPPTPKPVFPKRMGESLTIFGDPPLTLDPALIGDLDSAEYAVKIYSGLVALNKELEVIPDIAEDWDVSDDGTEYTFYLRDNVEFHDGTLVTAEDFKYSLERACDPATGSSVASLYLGDIVGVMDKLNGDAEEIDGVEVVDDYTLRITIDAPKTYFLSKLTYSTAVVVHEDNVRRGDWEENPIGTGPFKLTEYSDDRIVLERNDDYYRDLPKLDSVTYVLFGGIPMDMYETGEVDAVTIGTANVERVLDPNSSLHRDLRVVPQLDVWYVGFNTTMPPFDDVKVRQAFAYATDKQAIADVFFLKMVTPAWGILPPGMPGYNEDLEAMPFDVDKARELLEESSYGGAEDLPPIVFSVSGTGGPSAFSQLLAEMYAENLGVEIEIQQTDWGTFQEELHDREYQMYTLGWIADYPDPQNFLDFQFHSDSENNNGEYSNPEVDELLEEARVETDYFDRMELYQEAEEIIVNDAVWVPVYHEVTHLLVKPYVQDLELTSQGLYYLHDTYLESD